MAFGKKKKQKTDQQSFHGGSFLTGNDFEIIDISAAFHQLGGRRTDG